MFIKILFNSNANVSSPANLSKIHALNFKNIRILSNRFSENLREFQKKRST